MTSQLVWERKRGMRSVSSSWSQQTQNHHETEQTRTWAFEKASRTPTREFKEIRFGSKQKLSAIRSRTSRFYRTRPKRRCKKIFGDFPEGQTESQRTFKKKNKTNKKQFNFRSILAFRAKPWSSSSKKRKKKIKKERKKERKKKTLRKTKTRRRWKSSVSIQRRRIWP